MDNLRVESKPQPTPPSSADSMVPTTVAQSAPRDHLQLRQNVDRFERLMSRSKESRQSENQTSPASVVPELGRASVLQRRESNADNTRDSGEHEPSDNWVGDDESFRNGDNHAQFGNGNAEMQSAAGPLSFIDFVAQTNRSVVSATVSPAAAARSNETLEALVNLVADRILISDSATAGQEVRIQISDKILPGTEVRIFELEGQLTIQMATNRAESYDMLSAHQSDLIAQLDHRLQRDVVVEIELDNQAHSYHQGRSNRESSSEHDRAKEDATGEDGMESNEA